LDIDNCHWLWADWMFDPGYSPAAEPLSPEDAVIAMVQGKETLYDEEGASYFWSTERKVFKRRKNGEEWIDGNLFTGLCRRPEKRKRHWTTDDIEAWAESDASPGWVIRYGEGPWALPRSVVLIFSTDTSNYQRARLLPDMSGIDENTIQGFWVEE
jgi:hypothetical protein